jgi:glycosyltransferase involved in cell wall biosynthesis
MITDTYHPSFDGIVRYLDYLLPQLLAKGHEVTVVCPQLQGCRPYEFPRANLIIVRSATSRFRSNAYYYAFPDFRLVKAIWQADVVVLHSLMPLGTFGGVIARLLRKPVALFCHHDERVILQKVVKLPGLVTRFLYRLIKKFYRSIVQLFFHATERFKRKLLWFGVPEELTVHTPFAIPQGTFHPVPEIDLRQRYNIPPEGLIACYLGRLSLEKNVDNIIKAMDAAMDRHPDLYALIVGGGPDKELFLQQPCRNADRFIFTGYVPERELQSHFAVSDLFVTPTLNESSCFTVFEAMSCQVPVITAAKDHDPDIHHREQALLVEDVLDYREIEKNINLLVTDRALRTSLAANGLALIASRTWENHATIFLQHIHQLVRVHHKKQLLKPVKRLLRKDSRQQLEDQLKDLVGS